MRPRTAVAVLASVVIGLLALAAWMLSVPATFVVGGTVVALVFLAWRARKKAPNGKRSGLEVGVGNPDSDTRHT
ncbi:MAG: hypothetical protein U0132_06150 [Gemmatimonadaceae bacterium]